MHKKDFRENSGKVYFLGFLLVLSGGEGFGPRGTDSVSAFVFTLVLGRIR